MNYCCSMTATSNSSGGTEDLFVELTAAASSALAIKRVRICPVSPADTGQATIRLVTETVAGSGGAGGNITKVNKGFRASSATANVKSGATPFSLGTISATTGTAKRASFSNLTYWEWKADNPAEWLIIDGAQMFGVVIKDSSNSIIFTVDVEFED